MKKVILLFVAGICLAFSINAQDTREDLQFGVKAGVNYSNVFDSQGDQFNADPKIGLALGGFVAIPIGKYLGFHPELLFSQKGYKTNGSILGSAYEITHTTNYIDVPLLFALKPTEGFAIVLGPQYSYLLSQKDVFTNSILSYEDEQQFENDNVRKNTFGFLGGIDINLNPAVVGLRAGWDIQNNNGDGTSTIPRYKNMWYQATVGFKF